MHLSRLAITDLRLIAAATLEPAPGLNLVVGPNASGKTSLLEAIFLLGRGRPLRHGQATRLVRDGHERLRVVGELQSAGGRHRLGVERGRDGTQLRIDGRPAASALELARLLPLQFIHPQIHQLVESGPSLRRQFLDRGLFHVEPSFLATWRRYQRALRQRNAALKLGRGAPAWEGELALHGERLDRLRADYLDALRPHFQAGCARLLDSVPIDLDYRRGWSRERPLAAVLAADRDLDRRSGFTRHGPHRGDFRLRVGDQPLRDRASRGQQKLALCALQLAQARLQRERTGTAGLLLVDDLPAELDARHRQRLFEGLLASAAQLFVTATDRAPLEAVAEAAADPRWFHVEHGGFDAMV